MANKKITDLPSATLPLGGTEPLEIVQGGVNVQAPASAFGGTVPDADETTKGIAERATDAEVITGSDTTRFVSPASLHAKVIGVQDLWIPAAAMTPTITDGCSPLTQSQIVTSLLNIQTLDFDQTLEEHAQFQIKLPRKCSLATFKFKPKWTAAAGTAAQTVRWAAKAVAYSDGDDLTGALGSAVTVDDEFIAVDKQHTAPESTDVTIATPASEDFIAIDFSRVVSGDNLAADAKLLGVDIRLVTTAAKDA